MNYCLTCCVDAVLTYADMYIMRSKIFAKLKSYAKPVKPAEPKKSTIKRKKRHKSRDTVPFRSVSFQLQRFKVVNMDIGHL